MIDFYKKYKLKRQYHLGIVENRNYILAFTGEKCVFLNPIPALILNSIVKMNNLLEVSKKVEKVFGLTEEEAMKQVIKIVEKLTDYLEIDSKNKVYENVNWKQEDENILNMDKRFVCPIKKAENPRKIKFYLTEYCPRYCIYCFAGAKFIGKKKLIKHNFLTIDRFKELIIEAREFGVKNIEISGGDPFVLADIHEYLKVMVEHFPYEWGTSTKAFVSKEDAKMLKCIGLPEIQVSIDSFNPITADKMMGVKGAFEEVIQTINNLNEVGINVTAKATITSINIYDIPELFIKLIDMGIKYIRSSYYYISANRHDDYLYPNNEQFLWLNENMDYALRYAKEKGVPTDFVPHNLYDASNNNRLICGGFTDTLCVRYDGGVLFCDSLNHCEDFICGNLKNQGLEEVWNSKGVNNMNNPWYFHEKYKGTKCYDCHLYENCFYKRCYVRTYTEYGQYFNVDPACPFGNSKYIIK